MMKHKLLVIDDDSNFVNILQYQLKHEDFEFIPCEDFEAAQQSINQHDFAAILLDHQLGSQIGMDFIAPLTRLAPRSPIIMVTGLETVELVVQAMREGAFDFFSKPFDTARVIASLRKAVAHHELLVKVSQLENQQHHNVSREIIGESPQMQTVYQIISNVASTIVNVMITGESGTGKELIARAIHMNSPRHDKPFVALNMSALPKDLVESTLFGHEKGSFTGADKKRIGACEEADGGTLFLDELGEMPIELQPKLLRFLQERIYRPVGASKDYYADVRILSATNRDPLTEVHAGRLRADLYYRLNVVPLALPPLRDRTGDIDLLAMHAIRHYARQHGKKFENIEESALEILRNYDWPGNVRQLMHLIERVVVLNRGNHITSGMLPDEILHPVNIPTTMPTEPPVTFAPAPPVPAATAVTEASQPPTQTAPPVVEHQQPVSDPTPGPVAPPALPEEEPVIPLEELEKQAILRALDSCNGSATQAAKKLGISDATIYRKLKAYGIKK